MHIFSEINEEIIAFLKAIFIFLGESFLMKNVHKVRMTFKVTEAVLISKSVSATLRNSKVFVKE